MSARFSFGRNWKRYATGIDEQRVLCAMAAMAGSLGDLRGKSVLDIGCGSGIHVVSAARLGASRIHAFDYDTDSVECTREVVAAHLPADVRTSITIERGDALDGDYMRSLGTFDVVYAWGVLHHTGDMWKALDLATIPLAPNGCLLVALYNDQGIWSLGWKAMKWAYVRAPLLRPLILVGVFLPREATKFVIRTPGRYLRQWRNYRENRGMSRWHDIVDWAGGYPFEVASPVAVGEFYVRRGLTTTVTVDCGRGNGCNEFRITRSPSPVFPPASEPALERLTAVSHR